MQKIRNQITQIIGCFVKGLECIENVYEVSLKDLGVDRLAFVQILYIIEEQFNIEIPYDYMQEDWKDTIGELADMVAQLCIE